MNIVADIRRVMLDKGISQAELGRSLGMSPSQLSSILRDEDYNFTVKMLRRFAAALGTDLSITVGTPDPAPRHLATGGIIKGGITLEPITPYTVELTNMDPKIVEMLTGGN